MFLITTFTEIKIPMNTNTIRSKIDSELTRRIGTWFTVREIQDKLRVNPSTLKPLIMKYARESVLKRRSIRGTARSVEFTPAASSINNFKALLEKSMPYRNFGSSVVRGSVKKAAKAAKKPAKKAAPKKVAKKATKKAAPKKRK